MHVSRLQYRALQQQHQCCFVSLSSPGTIELSASSSLVWDLYTSCAPWATNYIRPPDAYASGATATAEITNTPNSAIERIIAILIVITRFLTKGSIKVYTCNILRLKKELTRRSLV
jgi:hypothetical protein